MVSLIHQVCPHKIRKKHICLYFRNYKWQKYIKFISWADEQLPGWYWNQISIHFISQLIAYGKQSKRSINIPNCTAVSVVCLDLISDKPPSLALFPGDCGRDCKSQGFVPTINLFGNEDILFQPVRGLKRGHLLASWETQPLLHWVWPFGRKSDIF